MAGFVQQIMAKRKMREVGRGDHSHVLDAVADTSKGPEGSGPHSPWWSRRWGWGGLILVELAGGFVWSRLKHAIVASVLSLFQGSKYR